MFEEGYGIKKWFIEHKYELLLVLFITAFGFFLRTWDIMSERIHEDPERVQRTVLINMYNNILNKGYNISSWLLPYHDIKEGILRGTKGIGYYWFLITMAKLVGADYSTVRYVSALFGTFTIPLIYAIGKIAFNKKVGILSAFFLATASWHVYYSRLGYADSTLIFFIALLMVFVLQGVTKSNKKWILCSTFPMMFMLLTKLSQGFPVVLAILIAILISKKRQQLLIPYLTAIILSFLPLLMWAYYLHTHHEAWVNFIVRMRIDTVPQWLHWMFLSQANSSPSLSWFVYSFATPRLGLIFVPALIGTGIILSKYRENLGELIVAAAFWIPTFLLIYKGQTGNVYYFMIGLPAYVVLAAYGMIEIVERIKAEKMTFATLALGTSLFYVSVALGTASFYYGALTYGFGFLITKFVWIYMLIMLVLASLVFFCNYNRIDFKHRKNAVLLGVYAYLVLIGLTPMVFLFKIFSTHFLL